MIYPQPITYIMIKEVFNVLSNYLLTGHNLVISRDTPKKTDSIMI